MVSALRQSASLKLGSPPAEIRDDLKSATQKVVRPFVASAPNYLLGEDRQQHCNLAAVTLVRSSA
eukprot:13221218-Alexandrium_andersonii.AAC.1